MDQTATDRRIYLVTDMEAGHGGKSGRYNALKDDALEFAFLLDLAGYSLPKTGQDK
jgi:oligopeptidase B